MRRFQFGLLILGLLGAVAGGPARAADPEEALRFNRDIRPILANTCFQCHGPDPGSRKAKLRFDREEGFFGAREGGPTVVKGKPEASALYQRLITKDPDDLMPPPKSHKVLKPEEKELIRKWIVQGAPWEPHWAFIRPERPAEPVVKNAKAVRNPIDRFILARVEAAGLQPAPEADRRTLARRASLDLTGLPPDPEQVEAFVADAAPDAYE
jgi:mono/diheme cytochrome c family protein